MYYTQNLKKFGVYDVDETGRTIGEHVFWEWEPEGRYPPFKPSFKFELPKPKDRKPGETTPYDVKNNDPTDPFDYSQGLAWLKSKLDKTTLFRDGLVVVPDEKCKKPMQPDEFLTKVDTFGMRIDHLKTYGLPPKPDSKSKLKDKLHLSKELKKWKNYLEPLNLCEATFEILLPEKPQGNHQYNGEEEQFTTATKNWYDFFTNDEPLLWQDKFPSNKSPGCPPWAAKKLAKLANEEIKVSKATKGLKEYPVAEQFSQKGHCLEQITGVLDFPRKGYYATKEQYKADLKEWKDWVARLGEGIEAKPPVFHQDPEKRKQAEMEQIEKDKAKQEKADQRKADKEQAEKEKAEKDQAKKEAEDKKKADRERLKQWLKDEKKKDKEDAAKEKAYQQNEKDKVKAAKEKHEQAKKQLANEKPWELFEVDFPASYTTILLEQSVWSNVIAVLESWETQIPAKYPAPPLEEMLDMVEDINIMPFVWYYAGLDDIVRENIPIAQLAIMVDQFAYEAYRIHVRLGLVDTTKISDSQRYSIDPYVKDIMPEAAVKAYRLWILDSRNDMNEVADFGGMQRIVPALPKRGLMKKIRMRLGLGLGLENRTITHHD